MNVATQHIFSSIYDILVWYWHVNNMHLTFPTKVNHDVEKTKVYLDNIGEFSPMWDNHLIILEKYYIVLVLHSKP